MRQQLQKACLFEVLANQIIQWLTWFVGLLKTSGPALLLHGPQGERQQPLSGRGIAHESALLWKQYLGSANYRIWFGSHLNLWPSHLKAANLTFENTVGVFLPVMCIGHLNNMYDWYRWSNVDNDADIYCHYTNQNFGAIFSYNLILHLSALSCFHRWMLA